MGTMRTLLLVALVGCSGPMTQLDAGSDAARIGDDAIVTPDAGTDAHADQVDAWSAPDAFVGPDAWAACDLYTNAGCTNPAQTCRPTRGTSTFDGPVACTDDGTIGEGHTACGPGAPCAHGLFCETGGRCVRACMHGAACPNTPDGTPQTCTTTGSGDIYHCSA